MNVLRFIKMSASSCLSISFALSRTKDRTEDHPQGSWSDGLTPRHAGDVPLNPSKRRFCENLLINKGLKTYQKRVALLLSISSLINEIKYENTYY